MGARVRIKTMLLVRTDFVEYSVSVIYVCEEQEVGLPQNKLISVLFI